MAKYESNEVDHCVHLSRYYCKICASLVVTDGTGGPFTVEQFARLQELMGITPPVAPSNLANAANDDPRVKKAQAALEQAEARHAPFERAYYDAVALVAEAELRTGNNMYSTTTNIIVDFRDLSPRQRRLAGQSLAKIRDALPDLRQAEEDARKRRDRSFENVIKAREAHRLALARAVLRLQWS